MSYRVLIQPTAFQEIETSYRWICDNLTPEIANNWYYDLQNLDQIECAIEFTLMMLVGGASLLRQTLRERNENRDNHDRQYSTINNPTENAN